MKILKKLELNNKSLEEFDNLMNYHLDQIEELEINEININYKLYNLISLCTNLKQLVIKGDLRSDVNKIFFNICNPENIETLVLDSVKLPTNKCFSKFSSLTTVSLNNINFSDLIGFLNKISNPDKIIALNLTNVDFGKRPISVFRKFENLKYLNLDKLNNCVFDNFDFMHECKQLSRFEFYNNEVDFDNINSLIRSKINKKIEITIKTSKECAVLNALEVSDNEAILTVNTCDLEKAINNVSIYKLSKMFMILENNLDINQYIKRLKKIKGNIILAINDINYFNVEDATIFKERLRLDFVNVLESPIELKITDDVQCYNIDDYIEIRKSFDNIILENNNELDELTKFNNIYNYFKNNIEYTEEKTDLKDIFINKKASYNYYALAMNSLLKELKFDSKVIKGKIGDSDETFLWNQVKINGDWYNYDIAYELKAKNNKKFLQYVFNSSLLNDEQFYKNHTPYLESKPETCYVELQDLKKEIKKEQSDYKISFWKKIYQKIISILKFNKDKALPAPDENEK